MSRRSIIKTKLAPYHVTAKSNDNEWFFLPMQEVWFIYEKLLCRISEMYQVDLLAFVLMSNHFQLLLSTPQQNLSEAMRYFLTETSKEIGRRSGRINHIFGGRYRWSVLKESRDFAYVYKYVYRNPVRTGICSRVERYPYSTFRKIREMNCRIPIMEGIDSTWNSIPREIGERTNWLNLPVSIETENLIGLGLRRYEFEIPEHARVEYFRKGLREQYAVESGPCG